MISHEFIFQVGCFSLMEYFIFSSGFFWFLLCLIISVCFMASLESICPFLIFKAWFYWWRIFNYSSTQAILISKQFLCLGNMCTSFNRWPILPFREWISSVHFCISSSIWPVVTFRNFSSWLDFLLFASWPILFLKIVISLRLFCASFTNLLASSQGCSCIIFLFFYNVSSASASLTWYVAFHFS